MVACVLAAALEGAFAGGGIKQRLREMKAPVYALPLWGWIIIGVLYYAMCFTVLYRLFDLSATLLRNVALVVLGLMMLINAGWNYFFFRTRNLFHAFVIGVPYNIAAVVLLLLLLRVDRTAAWSLVPYLFYLLYANLFGSRLWKLNG